MLMLGRGVGTVISTALIATNRLSPTVRLLRWSILGLGASWLILIVPSAPVAVFGAVLMGIAMSGAGISNLSFMQTWSASLYRGRALAFWYTTMNFGIVAGSLLTGSLVDHFGTTTTILVGGASTIVIWSATGGGRSERRLDPDDLA